jgi:retron-type reverse transcriptase
MRIKFKQYNLDQSPFYCLQSKRKLANLLGINLSKLRKLAHSENLYIERNEVDPKKDKTRHVEEPKPELKRVQKRIEQLLKRIKLPDFIHSPARRRSYVSNAQSHVNSAVVRSLDIKQYFPSTPSRRIYWFFHQRMKCSPDVAGILTELLTFKGCLPTGSPSSPILSYFGHIDMWEIISEIVKEANCTLTVYMDDVTISGENVSNKIVWQIKKQFYCCGLRDNKNKEKHYTGRIAHEVTGIIIKDGKLKIPNRQHFKMHEVRKLVIKETDLDKQKKLCQRLKGLESQAQQIAKANPE